MRTTDVLYSQIMDKIVKGGKVRFWSDNPQHWHGKHIDVTVLHASAGVAQQILLRSPSGTLLFDVGDGALRDVLSAGVNPLDIDAVFITHGHYDHMGGLHSLMGFMRTIGRTTKLPVAAPKGCREVELAVDGYQTSYRDTLPYEIELHELDAMERREIGDMVVTAYPVVHCGSTKAGGILPPIPAMGYRIRFGDEEVAITGDTGDCESVRELVTGADLAVVEATMTGKMATDDRLLHNVHLSEALAIEIGSLAKKHILVHRVAQKRMD
jgi:ribonuclease Z